MTDTATVLAADLRHVLDRMTGECATPCPAVQRLHAALMQPQLPLSDPDADTPGLARKDGNDTSKAARWVVMPRTGTKRRQVLNAFRVVDKAYGGERGMTDEQLCNFLRRDYSHVGPRRRELVAGGWLEDSGKRRPTSHGSDAVVWTLTDRAREALDAYGDRP